jgi:hypothetical protein
LQLFYSCIRNQLLRLWCSLNWSKFYSSFMEYGSSVPRLLNSVLNPVHISIFLYVYRLTWTPSIHLQAVIFKQTLKFTLVFSISYNVPYIVNISWTRVSFVIQNVARQLEETGNTGCGNGQCRSTLGKERKNILKHVTTHNLLLNEQVSPCHNSYPLIQWSMHSHYPFVKFTLEIIGC